MGHQPCIEVIPTEYGRRFWVRGNRMYGTSETMRHVAAICQRWADRWARRSNQVISTVRVRAYFDSATLRHYVVATWLGIENSHPVPLRREILDQLDTLEIALQYAPPAVAVGIANRLR